MTGLRGQRGYFQWKLVLMIGLWVALASGCALNRDQNATDPGATGGQSRSIDDGTQPVLIGNEATLERVEIEFIESTPVQINAIVSGTLPDACTKIERINQQQAEDMLLLSVVTVRQLNAECAGQDVPFAEGIHLNIVGLPAGTYTVTATGLNSASTSFNLSAEQAILTEPAANPAAAISGVVWEDDCRRLDDGSPAAGCVADDAGGYRPDGSPNDDENRLAGVLVVLRKGPCPGSEIVQTIATNVDGRFEFADLSPGDYCVAVDATVEPNLAVLRGGNWTQPATEGAAAIGQMTVALAANDSQTANFGWHFQDTAGAETLAGTEPDCIEGAAYIEDVTIPDDTPLPPGVEFVKTWRVLNTGTCTWGRGYALVFVAGEQMGAPTGVQFQTEVPPGEEVDLSVPLVAPDEEGTYRSDWKIRSRAGEVFGSRGDYAFYLQIVVQEGAAAP